ncbi:MAG: hypothetical protein L0Y62_02230 [Nitrospirae bacterium]|nr:hypothetical protein [Nitrospirota bacterium]
MYKKISLRFYSFFSALIIYSLVLCSGSIAAENRGEQTYPDAFRDEILSYFSPVAGAVTSVKGDVIKINVGAKNLAKKGMRLYAFKEGAPFIHPLTKEELGKIETPIGGIEITSVGANESTGIIISGTPLDFAKAKVKIAGLKIKILFCQGNLSWAIGEAYYQMLKETGRFELLDTGAEDCDMSKVTSEAKTKGADIVLMLHSSESGDGIRLSQKLVWTSDSKVFSEKKAALDAAYVKGLKAKGGAFSLMEDEVLLSFRLPFGARRLAVGDLDGDGKQEMLITFGDKIAAYKPGVDLARHSQIIVPLGADVLWIDTLDSNKNSRDEVLAVAIKDGEITSYIFEFDGSGFKQIKKLEDTFIKRLGNGIVGQNYTKRDGYDGDVFRIRYDNGKYIKGDKFKLPPDVNIYDFTFLHSPDRKISVLAWDERGYAYLYNEDGVKTWASSESFGGFPLKFKKESPTVMVERGEWSIKDRFIDRDAEILVPKKKPLAVMAQGLGYSSSSIRSLWWNGFTIEEKAFIERISGEILDYAIAGDRLIVLSKPFLGTTPQNILKGENPFGTMLYIFSLKGR